MNSTNLLDSSSEKSLGLQIYERLRSKLISGEFVPGNAVSIRKLAKEYKVSAMPVRDALKQLSIEGALIGAAKKAYRVPDLTFQQAADLFFVRAVLEGAGAEIAAQNLTPNDIEQLYAISEKVEVAWRNEDAHALLSANFRLHSTVYHKAGNLDLAVLVENIYMRTGPWLASAIRHLSTNDDWHGEHNLIIEAIAQGDQARARHLMENDARWGMRLFQRHAAR